MSSVLLAVVNHKKMTEFEWALENAEKNGFEACKDYTQQTIPMIGFRLKNKHVYHWFRITSEGWLMFDHSYSMNTGKSKRGVTARMHACNMFLPLGINHA
jgi:hypothetical protein